MLWGSFKKWCTRLFFADKGTFTSTRGLQHSQTSSSIYTSPVDLNADALRFLRERTSGQERSIRDVSALADEDYIACRVCGHYVYKKDLLNGAHCSPTCAQEYRLCVVCARPFVKERDDQRICSHPACHRRYMRQPGVKQIKYKLIED